VNLIEPFVSFMHVNQPRVECGMQVSIIRNVKKG